MDLFDLKFAWLHYRLLTDAYIITEYRHIPMSIGRTTIGMVGILSV